MKKTIYLILACAAITACSSYEGKEEMPPEEKWSERLASISNHDSLIQGSSYLSVYSHIYSGSEHRTHNLTAMISMRNTSKYERVFMKKAEYFNTEGRMVKSYIKNPIYIDPMETIEIMIFEEDEHGGTGGNFVFDWATPDSDNKPFIEGVMMSTNRNKAMAFTTQAVEIKRKIE
jgi:hypothetical protein